MMAPLWDVVGIGENSVDRVLHLELPIASALAAKSRVRSEERAVGGQVATTLCTCTALGLRAAYAGTFGDDEAGTFARAELERRGVDLSCAATRRSANRHATILVEPSGERHVLWSRDPALALQPDELPFALLNQTRLLHVDAVDPDASLRAAAIARGTGIVVTCDVDAPGPEAAALFEAATIPILAESVAAGLSGEHDPERALRALARWHDGMICVTLGARGAMLREGEAIHHAAAPAIVAVDTTGAGDVFRGAFIAALLEGRPPADILRFATAAAAASCRRVGAVAGVPTRSEIDELVLRAGM
jgi:sugar/nucleoside kinase (ribokinase family)